MGVEIMIEGHAHIAVVSCEGKNLRVGNCGKSDLGDMDCIPPQVTERPGGSRCEPLIKEHSVHATGRKGTESSSMAAAA